MPRWAGTINRPLGGYLKDPTGARRICPVLCPDGYQPTCATALRVLTAAFALIVEQGIKGRPDQVSRREITVDLREAVRGSTGRRNALTKVAMAYLAFDAIEKYCLAT